jgi:site-specific DNA-methyltransferase (cytosine-N4-specific)
MTIRFICADVMEGLRQLPDESVHVCVTSPPYFGLRSYLPKDHPSKRLEIGSEPTLAEHIAKLVEVFGEVRRVLRKDGTLWLNYGDLWAGSWWAQSRGEPSPERSTLSGGQIYAAPKGTHTGSRKKTGLKPKDLCLAPYRLGIALCDDGWWVRANIVWHKPNPTPSSVLDRPTPSHETVLLLSKSPRYFYDAQAIAEPSSWQLGNSKMPDGWDTGAGGHGSFHRQGREKGKSTRRAVACIEAARPPGTAPQTGMTRQWRPGKNETTGDRRKDGFNGRWDEAEADNSAPMTRNARDVWTIAAEPFPDSHYATFPTALAERCVKAGCPEGGTVLDPFGGSGTVGLVADRLGLGAILIDIDPANEAMAERRIARDRLARKQGTMADVAAAKLPPTPLEALMQDEAP